MTDLHQLKQHLSPSPEVKIKDEGGFCIHVTGKHSRKRAVTAAVCDVCGAPRPRSERWRLVWKNGLVGDLVLADLCARCAGESDRFLAMYGGRGRDAVTLTRQGFVSAAEPAPGRLQRVGGMIVRGVVYVLIALAAFVVVTLVTARGQLISLPATEPSCVPPSAPWPETTLVAAAAARRGRWLVPRAPVVAAGASAGVRAREWHRDAEDDAGKQTGDELAPAQPQNAGSPPLRAPQPAVRSLRRVTREHEMAAVSLLLCKRRDSCVTAPATSTRCERKRAFAGDFFL